jgi:hypothetical protein
VGFNIQAPGGMIACYSFEANTAPVVPPSSYYEPGTTAHKSRWIFKGLRPLGIDESPFFHRYYFGKGDRDGTSAVG